MSDPLEDIPALLHGSIRQIWKTVAGGAARYKATGNRGGLEGQKEISGLLQGAGILKNDPRWQRVIDHGRALYYGTALQSPSAPKPAPSFSGPSAARSHTPAVTQGHRRVVDWMGTPDFRQLVANADDAIGARGRVYFRPTGSGIVMIGLHEKCPGYVGLRTRARDNGHRLRVPSSVSVAEFAARWEKFEAWLPTVRRVSEEERGVIPWLRRTIANHLWLADLGEGWVFLHQEWRFIDDGGGGKKSDVLAVHVSTGRLGIVEFKDSGAKLHDARAQVDSYATHWSRDSGELAPLFTKLLRAQGAAYGNDQAATATVTTESAALFVGVASLGDGVRLAPR